MQVANRNYIQLHSSPVLHKKKRMKEQQFLNGIRTAPVILWWQYTHRM